MLCVTLGFPTLDELLAEQRRLIGAGVPLVEWRLDHLTESVDVAAAVRARPGPIVVTIRRPEDGGKWTGDETRRRDLLRAAIEAGAEFVDCEPDAAPHLPRNPATRRIVSIHDFKGTPADLPAIHARLAACGADVVKLATMATSTHDNTRMLRLLSTSTLPTVGLCMGELGMPTRILAPKFGGLFSFAALDRGPPLAPGQISFRTMLDLYRFDQITPSTPLYGVIGDPIGHSLSPLIHNRALIELGLPGVYVPFRVPPDDLRQFLIDCRELLVKGLSVTIPHKEAICAAMTDIDPAVTAIGAGNTLVFYGERLYGYNTDQRAAIDGLSVAMGWPTDRLPDLHDKTVLVLGAGGAAKAIVHGLRACGAAVVVTNRNRGRAEPIAEPLGATVVDWDARHTVSTDVIVNCTPLGMHPQVDETPYEAAYLRRDMIVCDTVYNPEYTRLLREARAAGCTIATGIEMFVRQAAVQFKLFTGHHAPQPVMRAAIAETLHS